MKKKLSVVILSIGVLLLVIGINYPKAIAAPGPIKMFLPLIYFNGNSYTPIPTQSATDTPTKVPTHTPITTFTSTPTNTVTDTLTPTNTATFTPTPTNTATDTPTPTNTGTYTPTPTNTATYTPTPTNTATDTPTPTNTATDTPTPSYTPTPTVIVVIAEHDMNDADWNGGTGWSGPYDRTGSTLFTEYAWSPPFSAEMRNTGTLTRVVDLTGRTNVQLSFWWKTWSFEKGEYATVEIYDGTWHTILTLEDGTEQRRNNFTEAVYDLSTYNMVSDFSIRFSIFGNAERDYLNIDDILFLGY